MKKLIPLLFLLLPSIAFAQLNVQQGGTGTSTVPFDYLLVGNSALHLSAIATSSLNLTTSSFASSNISQWTNNSDYLTSETDPLSLHLTDWYATTSAPQLTTLANLTTVGTISSGIWHGTAIGDTYISSSGNWNTAYTDRITGANYPLSITSNVLSVVATSSENCTVTCFLSHNVSQWTNDAGYLTANQTITLSGAVSGSGTTAITTSYAGTLGNSLGGTGQNSSAWTGLAGISGGAWYPISTSTAVNLNISGNSGTATALQNARTINGVSFNGSANIVVASTTLLGDTNAFTGTLDTFSHSTSTLGTITTGWATNFYATYASTTEVDASGTICLSGTCKTSWPTGTVTSVGLSSTNSTLTIGSTPVTTSGTITADLNLGHGNWWTSLQNFTNATTSGFEATSTNVFFDGPAAGSLLATNANKQLIATTTIGDNLLQNTTVSAGSYTNTNLTVNAQGLITAASNGSAGGGITWPWTQLTNWATSTDATTTAYTAPAYFASSTLASQFPYASTTALSASGTIYANNFYDTSLSGNTCVSESSSLIVGSTYCVTSVSGSWPIVSSGGTNPNITWAGISTSTNLVAGQVLFASAAGTIAGNTAFTFSTTGNTLLTVTNASTTNFTSGTWAGLNDASSTALSAYTGAFFGATATSSFNSVGTLTLQDADNGYSAITTPTRYLTLTYGTSTTMTGTSSASAAPSAIAPFAGTIKSYSCIATSTNAFINNALYIGTTQVLPDIVASNTVNTITPSSNNTFTKGQNISLLFGSSTANALNLGGNCTLSTVQTS